MPAARDRKQYHRDWYLRNRQKRLAQTAAYYASHKSLILSAGKEWSKRNPEKVKARELRYRNAHPENVQKWNREWHNKRTEEQRELKRKQQREHYSKNKQKVNARNRRWRQANKPLILARDLKRKALKIQATVNLAGITAWISLVKSRKTSTCYYCQKRVSVDKIHFDHIIPLSKGGSHSVENLCVACATCNLKKNNKPVRVFTRIGQQLLEV